MNATEINQTYDLLALAEGHTTLKKRGASYAGPFPFCGGTDRFVLLQKPDGWRWFCRHCGGGKYHTPIDYVMHLENCDFKTALRALGGKLQITSPARTAPPAPRPLIELNSEAWRREAWEFVNRASIRLFDDPEGQPSRDYLTRRGLRPNIIGRALLGFDIVYGRPAIVIPYFDEDGTRYTITGVKLRFIDQRAKDKKQRYSAPKFSTGESSKFYLYGMFGLCRQANRLVLVEGELNRNSIKQIDPEKTHVLSLGSETIDGIQKEILKVLAPKYEHVLIWMDNPDRALEVQTLMTRPDATLLRTVEKDGVKLDANELLQRGLLAEILTPYDLKFAHSSNLSRSDK